jgi:hypothetical protein
MMEEQRRKYKAERKANKSADFSSSKSKKSDLIDRLTK